MIQRELEQALDEIPGGRWAIGVSGGADSVALLRLALRRSDLRLVIVHLDHEARGDQSRADAAFVAELARKFSVDYRVVRRSEIEPRISRLPANRSARFRACRFRLFADVVHEHGLEGVLLAHHADDQAETILQRLLRGSGPMGLGGMSRMTRVRAGHPLTIFRPLLDVRGALLREFLRNIEQSWREDASNLSTAYQRNRVRGILQRQPALRDRLIELGTAMHHLRQWVRWAAPSMTDAIGWADLEGLPSLVAEEALGRWLIHVGVPVATIEPAVIERLKAMLDDAASSPRQHFPGKILLRRRQGRVSRQD